MSNSDAFEHIHRRRDSQVEKQLAVLRRQLEAFAANLPDMLRARRLDDLAPGSGLAGGGRGTDVSDPTGNTALRHDRTVEKWARFDEALAFLTTAGNTLTSLTFATLADPTPTGLCRDGACPEGRMADRGTKARDAVPRCHACHKFWLRDVVSPDLESVNGPEWKRRERQEKYQSPRWLGFPQQDQGAVA